MARYRFGATLADIGLTVSGGLLYAAGAKPLRFWDSQSGGSEITDLLDASSAAITAGAFQTNADGTFPLFYGPDGVKVMWVDNASVPFAPERGKISGHIDDILAAIATGGAGTAPTAEKTTSYTAVAGDFIPVDLTSGNAAIALPNAPADKTQVAVQVVAVSTGVVGAYTATINRAGTDTFKRTTGPTSLTMTSLEHTLVLQYKTSNKVWYVVSGNRATATDTAINAAAYAPLGVNDQYFAAGTTDVVKGGWPLDELYHPAAVTYTDALTTQLVPNLASGTVVYQMDDWNPATNTKTSVGTMTLLAAGGTATATANTRTARLNASFTIAAGHFLRWYISTTNGTGYWGQGPMLHLRQSGSFTLPSAPTAPGSAPTTASGSGTVTLTQALTTGAAEMLYVDTGAAQPIGRTQGGSFVQSGLITGSSSTYATMALAPWVASTISPNTAAVGPSAGSFSSFTVDGTFDAAALYTVTNGSSSGVSSTVTTGIWTFVSGSAGTGGTANVQDTSYNQFAGETGTGANVHSAMRGIGVVALGDSRDSWNALVSADNFVSLATTQTHFLQFQFNAVGIRVGYKAGGSFTKLSETGNANLTFVGTSTDANGQLHYSATQTTDGAHYYGVGFDIGLIDGSGNQTINVYSGTEAQAAFGFGGSGLPLIATILVPAAVRSAIPAGYAALNPLGDNNATVKTLRMKSWIWTPVSPKGA